MQTNYRVIKESKMNRNIYFQLVSGNFKNKYAIQYIKRLKIKDRMKLQIV